MPLQWILQNMDAAQRIHLRYLSNPINLYLFLLMNVKDYHIKVQNYLLTPKEQVEQLRLYSSFLSQFQYYKVKIEEAMCSGNSANEEEVRYILKLLSGVWKKTVHSTTIVTFINKEESQATRNLISRLRRLEKLYADALRTIFDDKQVRIRFAIRTEEGRQANQSLKKIHKKEVEIVIGLTNLVTVVKLLKTADQNQCLQNLLYSVFVENAQALDPSSYSISAEELQRFQSEKNVEKVRIQWKGLGVDMETLKNHIASLAPILKYSLNPKKTEYSRSSNQESKPDEAYKQLIQKYQMLKGNSVEQAVIALRIQRQYALFLNDRLCLFQAKEPNKTPSEQTIQDNSRILGQLLERIGEKQLDLSFGTQISNLLMHYRSFYLKGMKQCKDPNKIDEKSYFFHGKSSKQWTFIYKTSERKYLLTTLDPQSIEKGIQRDVTVLCKNALHRRQMTKAKIKEACEKLSKEQIKQQFDVYAQDLYSAFVYKLIGEYMHQLQEEEKKGRFAKVPLKIEFN